MHSRGSHSASGGMGTWSRRLLRTPRRVGALISAAAVLLHGFGFAQVSGASVGGSRAPPGSSSRGSSASASPALQNREASPSAVVGEPEDSGGLDARIAEVRAQVQKELETLHELETKRNAAQERERACADAEQQTRPESRPVHRVVHVYGNVSHRLLRTHDEHITRTDPPSESHKTAVREHAVARRAHRVAWQAVEDQRNVVGEWEQRKNDLEAEQKLARRMAAGRQNQELQEDACEQPASCHHAAADAHRRIDAFHRQLRKLRAHSESAGDIIEKVKKQERERALYGVVPPWPNEALETRVLERTRAAVGRDARGRDGKLGHLRDSIAPEDVDAGALQIAARFFAGRGQSLLDPQKPPRGAVYESDAPTRRLREQNRVEWELLDHAGDGVAAAGGNRLAKTTQPVAVWQWYRNLATVRAIGERRLQKWHGDRAAKERALNQVLQIFGEDKPLSSSARRVDALKNRFASMEALFVEAVELLFGKCAPGEMLDLAAMEPMRQEYLGSRAAELQSVLAPPGAAGKASPLAPFFDGTTDRRQAFLALPSVSRGYARGFFPLAHADKLTRLSCLHDEVEREPEPNKLSKVLVASFGLWHEFPGFFGDIVAELVSLEVEFREALAETLRAVEEERVSTMLDSPATSSSLSGTGSGAQIGGQLQREEAPFDGHDRDRRILVRQQSSVLGRFLEYYAGHYATFRMRPEQEYFFSRWEQKYSVLRRDEVKSIFPSAFDSGYSPLSGVVKQAKALYDRLPVSLGTGPPGGQKGDFFAHKNVRQFVAGCYHLAAFVHHTLVDDLRVRRGDFFAALPEVMEHNFEVSPYSWGHSPIAGKDKKKVSALLVMQNRDASRLSQRFEKNDWPALAELGRQRTKFDLEGKGAFGFAAPWVVEKPTAGNRYSSPERRPGRREMEEHLNGASKFSLDTTRGATVTYRSVHQEMTATQQKFFQLQDFYVELDEEQQAEDGWLYGRRASSGRSGQSVARPAPPLSAFEKKMQAAQLELSAVGSFLFTWVEEETLQSAQARASFRKDQRAKQNQRWNDSDDDPFGTPARLRVLGLVEPLSDVSAEEFLFGGQKLSAPRYEDPLDRFRSHSTRTNIANSPPRAQFRTFTSRERCAEAIALLREFGGEAVHADRIRTSPVTALLHACVEEKKVVEQKMNKEVAELEPTPFAPSTTSSSSSSTDVPAPSKADTRSGTPDGKGSNVDDGDVSLIARYLTAISMLERVVPLLLPVTVEVVGNDNEEILLMTTVTPTTPLWEIRRRLMLQDLFKPKRAPAAGDAEAETNSARAVEAGGEAGDVGDQLLVLMGGRSRIVDGVEGEEKKDLEWSFSCEGGHYAQIIGDLLEVGEKEKEQEVVASGSMGAAPLSERKVTLKVAKVQC